MAGTVFEYFNGYLRVAFSNGYPGDINVVFTFHGDTVSQTPFDDNFVKGKPDTKVATGRTVRTVTSSSMSWFFADMIAWLEAAIIGVRECAFNWDGEGPEGTLRWFNRGASGRLVLNWDGMRDQPSTVHEVRLDKAQMVRAFYESFRNFVESDRYDPLPYEKLASGERCALVLEGANLDALADELAVRDRRAAYHLLSAVLDRACDYQAGYPRRATLADFVATADARSAMRLNARADVDAWFTKAWDTWVREMRRGYVLDTVFPGGTLTGFGERLRELRSPRIEEWLARHADTAVMSEGPRT
jgi:hypothetical protein